MAAFAAAPGGWTVQSANGTLTGVMVNAICVHTTLESETMRIPELSPFIGKKVQIIVMEDDEPERGHDRAAQRTDGLETVPKRTLGSLRGVLTVPDDFDDPLPDEILRAFEGEGEGGG
jgi:hypothetical protein